MSRVSDRLRIRGKQLKLSQAEVARRVGISPERYGQYVRGEYEPDFATLVKICRALRCTPDYLFGFVDSPGDHAEISGESHPPPAYVGVQMLELRPGMGGGAFDDLGEGQTIFFPERLVRAQLNAVPEDLRAMEVEGQSMEPLLYSGDQVLVDLRKRNPSQPGAFALFDGFGLVVKLVERVTNTDPPRLKVFSANPLYQAKEYAADEVHIQGRVVWFARRL